MSGPAPKHAVRITGGLGNQLFQAAFALALRERTGQPVELDLSWFERGSSDSGEKLMPYERYRLPELGFSALPTGSSIAHRRGTGFGQAFNLVNLQLHAKASRSFGPLYHRGYWQGENHFADVADTVAEHVRIPPPTSRAARHVVEQIRRSERAVSMHVRRGNYLAYADLLPACQPSYYRAAVDHIGPRGDLFVFSDDIEYCRSEFSDLEKVTFVEGSASDLEDLALMAMCGAHVIGNSSFAWWGAWLAERNSGETHEVVGPKRWINLEAMARTMRRYFEPDEILPSRWTALEDPGSP